MKYNYWLLLLLLLQSFTSFAQITEVKVCDDDTVHLKVALYHGQVTWQATADTVNWYDVVSGDTLTIVSCPDSLYRAVVKDGTCDSVVSDTISVRFYPVPTIAFAGADQLNINGITVTLIADSALVGNGTWSIISGTGGQLASAGSASSTFSGLGATTYTLVWTVANECRSSSDTVQISFAMPHVNFNGTLWVHPTDNSGGAIWGCQGTTTNATSLTNGEQNTTLIVGVCNDATIAARKCADLVAYGYSDWYLPAKDELNALFTNRYTLGGFYTQPGMVYWSSTESSSVWANAQNFNTGAQSTINQKSGACRVRCVRRD